MMIGLKSLLIHPWVRRAATLGLWLLSLGVAIAFAPRLIERWQSLSRLITPPPIEVHNVRLSWETPMALQAATDGSVWRTTCPRITVTRLFVLDDGNVVPATANVLDRATGLIAGVPRHNMAIEPAQHGPIRLSVTFPPWFKEPWRARHYIGAGSVGEDEPCSDGWTGSWRLFTADVPLWPYHLPDKPGATHRPGSPTAAPR